MKIQCPECSTVYAIDASKIPEKGARLQCKKCPAKIHVPGIRRQESAQKYPGLLSEEFIKEKYIRGKDEDAVAKALYEGIVSYVDANQFIQAEQLREKLIEVAPMALSEIVETADIIDNKKAEAMDIDKVKPWAGLFDTFEKNEAADFYFTLQELHVAEKKAVFEQGEYDNRLYFIRSGKLQLTYYDQENDENREVAIFGKGDIAGDETFFSFTNHTTTLTATEDSEVFYVERETFERMAGNHPAIKSKLFDYCKKNQKPVQIDDKEGHARRVYERYPVYLKGKIRRFEPDGNLGEPTVSNVLDISLGGMCFTLRNLKTEEAEKLHQSRIEVTVIYGEEPDEKELKKIADVVAVRIMGFDESTVHVKFKDPLDETLLSEITEDLLKDKE